MDWPHDMGGQLGFGPLPLEDDEPVFHSEWERRVLALSVASAAMFGTIDRRRHALELLDRETYLRCSYYERWLERLERVSVSDGWLTESELENGKATIFDREIAPVAPEQMEATIRAGRPSDRDSGVQEPMFEVGQRVRTIDSEPHGHTRLPAYARGKIGVIKRLHGTHCFPDTSAHNQGENPQPLYSVAFLATDLWGPACSDRDKVFLDLWQSYLKSSED